MPSYMLRKLLVEQVLEDGDQRKKVMSVQADAPFPVRCGCVELVL